MTRLPKRYFKSISDYVKAYYTAYGAQRAQKLYDAVKTVTKDFTRTDPVYVRIGEDGEPEIHYTMTQARGTEFFKKMSIGNGSLYLHNGAICTNILGMFNAFDAKFVQVDSFSGAYDGMSVFGGTSDGKYIGTRKVGLFDTSGLHDIRYFMAYSPATEVPAFDLSSVNDAYYAFTGAKNVNSFKAYGLKVSFDISSTALKHDAILEVFNNLGTVDATAGITLTLGSEKLALMSDEEKAIATGKGWVLA